MNYKMYLINNFFILIYTYRSFFNDVVYYLHSISYCTLYNNYIILDYFKHIKTYSMFNKCELTHIITAEKKININ